jgi:UDP-N-acetylglucosamine--N-acetylmuramyl-(pentapeptide) pyrophosphoryl-undecaprenol N-acetylglucosamine transferase
VRPVVIAAGGTGGHLFPAEALASALIARGHRIVLMTDARSGGLASSVFAGRESFVLSGGGLASGGALRKARGAAMLALGTLQARKHLGGLDASVVVGFGGYPSVGPVMAARMLKRPPAVILHEQNAVLGRANAFLAKRADVLALSFAETSGIPEGVRTAVPGNPVRPAIQALAGQPYVAPTDRINLLVLGGSLGARILSDVVPPALAALPDALRARIALTQQVRAEDLDRVRAAHAASGVAAEIAPFFPDVASRLASAHLVIARAGATTVAEIAVAGRPAIFIPLPVAIGHDQGENARALVEAGAASMLRQETLTPEQLTQRLTALLAAPDMLANAAQAASKLGKPNAAAALADLVELRIGQQVAS